jgi:hypothetical protein
MRIERGRRRCLFRVTTTGRGMVSRRQRAGIHIEVRHGCSQVCCGTRVAQLQTMMTVLTRVPVLSQGPRCPIANSRGQLARSRPSSRRDASAVEAGSWLSVSERRGTWRIGAEPPSEVLGDGTEAGQLSSNSYHARACIRGDTVTGQLCARVSCLCRVAWL